MREEPVPACSKMKEAPQIFAVSAGPAVKPPGVWFNFTFFHYNESPDRIQGYWGGMDK